MTDFGAILADVVEGYYDKTGLDLQTDAIAACYWCRDAFVRADIVVRIRLDGYEIQFFHNPAFVVPPHDLWDKQGSWMWGRQPVLT